MGTVSMHRPHALQVSVNCLAMCGACQEQTCEVCEVLLLLHVGIVSKPGTWQVAGVFALAVHCQHILVLVLLHGRVHDLHPPEHVPVCMVSTVQLCLAIGSCALSTWDVMSVQKRLRGAMHGMVAKTLNPKAILDASAASRRLSIAAGGIYIHLYLGKPLRTFTESRIDVLIKQPKPLDAFAGHHEYVVHRFITHVCPARHQTA